MVSVTVPPSKGNARQGRSLSFHLGLRRVRGTQGLGRDAPLRPAPGSGDAHEGAVRARSPLSSPERRLDERPGSSPQPGVGPSDRARPGPGRRPAASAVQPPGGGTPSPCAPPPSPASLHCLLGKSSADQRARPPELWARLFLRCGGRDAPTAWPDQARGREAGQGGAHPRGASGVERLPARAPGRLGRPRFPARPCVGEADCT